MHKYDARRAPVSSNEAEIKEREEIAALPGPPAPLYWSAMRRTDRQVTDFEQMLNWLREAPVGRIAFANAGEAYVVPLNFGILAADPLTLVFHSAPSGRKLEMMAQNPSVCFETDLPGELREAGDNACGWGMAFRSLIGWGRLEPCSSSRSTC